MIFLLARPPRLYCLSVGNIKHKETQTIINWIHQKCFRINIHNVLNFVIFHPPQKKIDKAICLEIKKKLIEQKNSIKYLGIIIDSNLSWKEHIHQLSKKISRGIGIISKLRHYVNKSILVQLYYSLIYPFLTYGLIIWGNTYKTTLEPLIILQKKVIRIMNFSNYNDHTSPLFTYLNIMKLPDVIYYHNCIFLFKFNSKMLPTIFDNFFELISSRHKYKTRLASRSSFYIPSIRTNYGKFSIRYQGATIWNDIDETIKQLSLCRFKKEIKSKIISQY